MGYAATIGFFDGVHRGHQHIINMVLAEAYALRATDSKAQAMVISFARQPREVLSTNGYSPQLLTTNNEKTALLQQAGIERVVLLDFDRRMAALSAQEFMRTVLCDQLQVSTLVAGYDNRFGHDRSEGFDDYCRYGRELGIAVKRGDALTVDDTSISSSAIRSLLTNGHIDRADAFLGRRYGICGLVVCGWQNGRKIGFPTANLAVDNPQKLIPQNGVYAAMVRIDNNGEQTAGKSSAVALPAMMNIGCRPTFGGGQRSIEVHAFNFSGNLYGHTITVEFVARLREERRFPSPEALAEQLQQDKAMALKLLGE